MREFVAGTREAIAGADAPEHACDAIRPHFAELLADEGWLPDGYAVPSGERRAFQSGYVNVDCP